MVLCCKLITESAVRSSSVSPSRSPTRLSAISSSLSNLISSLDYQACGEIDADVVESIPKRELKLLAALARKRKENDERERLAEEFRRLWEREDEERKMLEAESSDQFKQYIHKRRDQERFLHDLRRSEIMSEQQVKRGQLLDCIRHKDLRSRDVLSNHLDKKTTEIVQKSLDFQSRMLSAAERRMRQSESEGFRRELEMYQLENRLQEARRKRDALLKDASQRVAVSNVLSAWESAVLRQEVEAMEATRRAHHAASAALTDARSVRLARAREARVRRARQMAALTAQLRDSVRGVRR